MKLNFLLLNEYYQELFLTVETPDLRVIGQILLRLIRLLSERKNLASVTILYKRKATFIEVNYLDLVVLGISSSLAIKIDDKVELS